METGAGNSQRGYDLAFEDTYQWWCDDKLEVITTSGDMQWVLEPLGRAEREEQITPKLGYVVLHEQTSELAQS